MTKETMKKISYYELVFGENYKAWVDTTNDDRKIFCNRYEQIIKAFKDIDGIDNSLVISAVNKRANEIRETMIHIEERFMVTVH